MIEFTNYNIAKRLKFRVSVLTDDNSSNIYVPSEYFTFFKQGNKVLINPSLSEKEMVRIINKNMIFHVTRSFCDSFFISSNIASILSLKSIDELELLELVQKPKERIPLTDLLKSDEETDKVFAYNNLNSLRKLKESSEDNREKEHNDYIYALVYALAALESAKNNSSNENNKPSEVEDEHEKLIKPGSIVKHFKRELIKGEKGTKYLYQVISISGINTETGERYVVYKPLYDCSDAGIPKEDGLAIRPYDMFMSEIDRNKYPEIKQKYRFELYEM